MQNFEGNMLRPNTFTLKQDKKMLENYLGFYSCSCKYFSG